MRFSVLILPFAEQKIFMVSVKAHESLYNKHPSLITCKICFLNAASVVTD